MSRRYSPDFRALAAKHNIPESDFPLYTNGCSGGLSWAYRLAFGRDISCEHCCDLHDLLYTLGELEGTRKEADRKLRDCVRRAGSFPEGWRGKARKAVRWARAWVMYTAVRMCGGRYY